MGAAGTAGPRARTRTRAAAISEGEAPEEVLNMSGIVRSEDPYRQAARLKAESATCTHPGCEKPIDREELCFRHRVLGIGFDFKGSAMPGRGGWNKTANDFKLENFGTTNEKELATRGIERADKYGVA